MAVLVRVAPVAKGGGGSSAGRYLVKRELDLERESRETRQIFTAREDNLTHWKADKYMAGDADRLDKEDIHHLIISLLPEEYERLGDNDLARREVIIEVMREALRNLSAHDLDGYEFRWAASLHLNTRLPHIHLLMHKEFADPITGEKKVLQKLPRELLAERGSTLRDEDPARLGKISQRFKEALDEHSRPFRHVQIRDAESRILADREVIEGKTLNERKPTFEEVSVGRWVVAEAKAARAEGESVSPPIALREYVRKLDAHTAARGSNPTAAFLSQEQISELTGYRTSGLHITLHTEALTYRNAPERPSREMPDRLPPRVEHERQHFRSAPTPEKDESRPGQIPKDGLLKERQDHEGLRIVDREAQIPRQAEGLSVVSKTKIEESSARFARVAVDGDEKSYLKSRPKPEESVRKKKLRAEEELFESRGRALIQQYLAFAANPSHVKEFTKAAKEHLEAGQHVDTLVKNFRKTYRQDPPTGTILSSTDRDSLVRNVPRLHHLPGNVRNELVRDAIAAKPSDHARSYLPREQRPFQQRRPTRGGKGVRGR